MAQEASLRIEQHSEINTGDLFVLGAIILLWGAGWPVMKLALRETPPLWFAEIRFSTAALCLLVISTIKRQLSFPHVTDVPMVISGSLLMMVGFTVSIAFALQTLPAGRSVVLAYTSPLWVCPAARVILKEKIDLQRAAGALLGVSGITLIVGPWTLDWASSEAFVSANLLIIASMLWAAYIVHMRMHSLVTGALTIVTWQTTLAAGIMLPLTVLVEGGPRIPSIKTFLEMMYVGPLATALCFWGTLVLGQRIPALIISTGLTGVPLVGIVISVMFFHEKVSPAAALGIGAVLIGLLAVTIRRRSARTDPATSIGFSHIPSVRNHDQSRIFQ